MKKRNRNLHTEERVDEEGSWAISYGDMITVLMSFFILYFSMDPQDHADKQLTQSLVAALSETEKPKKVKNFVPENIKFGDQKDGDSVDEKIINILGARLTKMGVKLIIEFPNVSFFESGRIDVREDAKQALALFVQKYIPYSGQFVLGVQAYTDKTPVRMIEGRRFKDNLELSALRSIAAMRILQASGLSFKDMKLSGYGEYNKIIEKLNEKVSKEKRNSLSRKVVLVIEPKDKESSDDEA